MGTVVAILSQLFWGVTVGALTGTAALVGKLLAVAGGLFGGGFAVFKWRKLLALLPFRRR
jgi:hypothetical protein